MNVMFSEAPTKLITPSVRITQLWLSVLSVHFWRIYHLTPKTSKLLQKEQSRRTSCLLALR